MKVDAGWATSGYLPWSLGHFVFRVSAEIIFVGVHADDISGFSYASKVDALQKLSAEVLNDNLKHNRNFVINLLPGELVFLPPNVIVHQHALKEGTFIRWPVLDAANKLEVKKALSSSLSVASSYPSLAKDAFASWMSFLQERTTSA